MTLINYSNQNINKLAELSYEDTAAHPELFGKLAVSAVSHGKYPSLYAENILKILRDMGVQLASIAARGIGTSYLKSQKTSLFEGLNILIQKDLRGTVQRVAQVAAEKLTRVQNFTLLTRVIARDPEIGLKVFDTFNITQKNTLAAVKNLILVAATANKTDLIAPLIIRAKDHFNKVISAELINQIIDISPQFAVALTDKLDLNTDEKAKLIVKLSEKFPEAYQTVKNGQFYEKISKLKPTERINIDAPLFGGIKDKSIGLKDLISSHAQKRTHLFFNVLTAYYKTGFSLSLNKTFFRYGKGLRSAEGNFDGAHTSIITSLKIKKTAADTFWDQASFYDLYLAHSCNATYYLPVSANNVDSKIEGKNNSGEYLLRKRSIRILQKVSSGEIDPEAGMYEYLQEFGNVVQGLMNKGELSAEHRQYLGYQLEGTCKIMDSKGGILGNFFRYNLALTFPENPEIHGALKQYEWKDLTKEFKESLFIRAQQQTQSQRVLVVNGKATSV